LIKNKIIINIKEIQMRSILFAALAALASAASHKGTFVSVSKEIPVHADADPAQKYYLSVSYDFDFGYAFATDQEPAADDGVNGPLIIDNWVKFELWSDANIGFTLNLFGLHIADINVNIVPFKIIPLWLSIYNTHPYRVLNGDDLNIFTQLGYELHAGEVQLQYVFSNFLPKVSLYDFLFDGAEPLPVNALTETITDINDRTDAGWDYSSAKEDFKDDPYFNFNALEYILG
jgi:hypothetical protein